MLKQLRAILNLMALDRRMPSTKVPPPKPILEGFGVDSHPNELVLGTYDRHVTVYDQQVKSLNLAYRLKSHGVIPNSDPIVVIGAGVAGLTFAAGCIWHGQEVHLIEKQWVPCHLQRGCDIRWLR